MSDPIQSFSTMYRAFEDAFRGDPTLIRKRLTIYLPLVEQVVAGATSERRALDLGAGRGEWVKLLSENGFDALGIDANPGMVSAAAEAGIKVRQADIFDHLKQTPTGSLAIVTAFHVVEHLPIEVLIALLKEIERVLVPGGLVILETPNPENLSVASHTFRLDPTHQHPLPPQLLSFLAGQAALSANSIFRLNGSASPHGDALMRGLSAMFQAAPDYALLATKGGCGAAEQMGSAIAAFVERSSEPHPIAALLQSTTSVAGASIAATTPPRNRNAEFEGRIRQLGDRLAGIEGNLALRSGRRATQVVGIVRRLRWAAWSWLTFRPGARPHRIAKTTIVSLYADESRGGPAHRAARRLIALVPNVEERARSIARNAVTPKPAPTAFATVPENSPARLEPESVQVAYARLAAASHTPADGIVAVPSAGRHTLAVVTPIPPARTGIAHFAALLLPLLDEHYAITIITDQDSEATTIADTMFQVRGVEWFKQNAWQFERVLYHFGNSPFHAHMIDLIRKYPGVIVMHDASTSDLFAGLERQEGWSGFWWNELLASHGYDALRERQTNPDPLAVILQYPSNLRLLRDAQGVIVNSDYAKSFFDRHYGRAFSKRCRVIPLSRPLPPLPDRSALRQRLGIPQDVFLVCSMGAIDAHKAVDRILDAWMHAGFDRDGKAMLRLAGAAGDTPFNQAFQERVAGLGDDANVAITGYASEDDYDAYIGAADCIVQLRTQTRGETSGAVIDAMAAGRCVIVNSHGALAELPADAVIMLPDAVQPSDLADALMTLRDDSSERHNLEERARAAVATGNAPEAAATAYADAIENFARDAPAVYSLPLLRSIARHYTRRPEGLLDRARRIAPPYANRRKQRQLLVDVSVVARNDIRTGIQRVVRSQLMGLFASPPDGFRVEPVMLTNHGGHWVYEYAHDYGAGLHGAPGATFPQAVVDAVAGDILFVVDFALDWCIAASEQGLYDAWRRAGVSINVAVYDILPLTLPSRFPWYAEELHGTWLSQIAQFSDHLVCISETVAAETRDWLSSYDPDLRLPAIVGVPLGADIEASAPTTGLPDDADRVLAQIDEVPTFIMVGTIEPRKGHLQAIAAFETLWAEGRTERLLIVGAEGWMGLPAKHKRTIPQILSTIRESPNLGNRLLWLDRVSDEYLEKLYAASACLLAASEGEGFGLPLVEAARHGIPVLARDIPVFREIGQNDVTYFSGGGAEDLAAAIRSWVAGGARPPASASPPRTWRENVEHLKSVLID